MTKIGIERTGSYGSGLSRYLRRVGVEVIEVDRPNREERRRSGKSDPLDAVEAARAALSGRASGSPKSGDGAIEAIRVLVVPRDPLARPELRPSSRCATSATRRLSSSVADSKGFLCQPSSPRRPSCGPRVQPIR